MTRVDIAIVHFHAEALLYRCLTCLRASELQDFRVLVVDNGSRTGLPWVEHLDTRFRLVSSGRNLGFAAANNIALRELRGASPWTLFLNPDTFVEPDTLGELLETVQDDATIGAATCKLLRPWGEIDPACHRGDPSLLSALAKQTGLARLFPGAPRLGSYHLHGLDLDESHDIQNGTAAFLLVRTSVLAAMREPFDPRFFLYGEDLDLCRRIRGAGHRIRYVPTVTAVHVKGSGRIRSARTTWHFYRAMWVYYRKWGHFRRHPLVLGPLAVAIGTLLGLELTANATRRLVGARRGLRSLELEI